MACPNCDHTMQSVSEWVWWCPRCGTIKDPNGNEKPKLVSQVVKFAGHFGANDDTVIPWMRQFGIIESITLPENRR